MVENSRRIPNHKFNQEIKEESESLKHRIYNCVCLDFGLQLHYTLHSVNLMGGRGRLLACELIQWARNLPHESKQNESKLTNSMSNYVFCSLW